MTFFQFFFFCFVFCHRHYLNWTPVLVNYKYSTLMSAQLPEIGVCASQVLFYILPNKMTVRKKTNQVLAARRSVMDSCSQIEHKSSAATIASRPGTRLSLRCSVGGRVGTCPQVPPTQEEDGLLGAAGGGDYCKQVGSHFLPPKRSNFTVRTGISVSQ